MRMRKAGWIQIGLVAAGLELVSACGSFSSKDGVEGPFPDADGGPAAVDGGPAVDAPAASPFVVSLQAGPRVELTRGKRTDVVVQVTRRTGYAGEAVITVRDLPQGVTAEPLVILGGERTGTLGLTATEAVSHGVATPVVVASTRGNSLPSSEAKLDLVLRGLPGSVDESFGKKGTVEVPLPGDEFAAFSSLSDGRLVYGAFGGASPNIAVGRLQANGTLDTAFGMQGIRRFAFGAGSDQAVSVLATPDGKTVVVGTAVAEARVGLARLTSAGALDATFAGSGTTMVGTTLAAIRGRLADDGSIFVLARVPGFDLSIGKVTPAGSMDAGFGAGGWLTIPRSSFASAVRLIGSDIVVSTTKIIVSFVVVRDGGNSRVGIATLARSGQGAPVLGESAVSNVTQYELPLVVRSDGSAVVGLNNLTSGTEGGLLYGFESDGTRQDDTFGNSNPVRFPSNDVPYSMVTDSSNRLLVATQLDAAPTKFRLHRFLPQGPLDVGFGAGGLSETLVGDGSRAKAVASQKDGRILVGGNRTSGAVRAPAFVRYWP